jgi:hypothetical protein
MPNFAPSGMIPDFIGRGRHGGPSGVRLYERAKCRGHTRIDRIERQAWELGGEGVRCIQSAPKVLLDRLDEGDLLHHRVVVV